MLNGLILSAALAVGQFSTDWRDFVIVGKPPDDEAKQMADARVKGFAAEYYKKWLLPLTPKAFALTIMEHPEATQDFTFFRFPGQHVRSGRYATVSFSYYFMEGSQDVRFIIETYTSEKKYQWEYGEDLTSVLLPQPTKRARSRGAIWKKHKVKLKIPIQVQRIGMKFEFVYQDGYRRGLCIIDDLKVEQVGLNP